MTRLPTRLLAPALLLALLAAPALAHEGHDHGPPVAPPSQREGERAAETTSPAVELLVRWPASAPGEPVPMRLFLSDWATNRPLTGATLELTFQGAAAAQATAQATKSPGVYEARVAFPKAGRYTMTATAMGPELAEVLAVPGLEIGPEPEAAAAAPDDHAHAWDHLWPAAAAVGLVLLAWVGFVTTRRRTRVAAVAAALVVVPSLTVGGWRAWAHGGDDHAHEDEAPAPTVRTARSLPGRGQVVRKETQFLLGIETAVAAVTPLAERLLVTGEVSAPPDRRAAMLAPQGGQLHPATPEARLPTIGERVERGQVLGYVEAVLGASERASFASERGRAAAEAQGAAARAAAARRHLTRLRGLEGIVSKRDLESAEAELKAAEAEARGARAAGAAFSEASAATRLPVRAPIAGVVTSVGAAAGELVEAGHSLWTVTDPSVVWARARVAEGDFGRVAEGEAAVLVDAWPGERFRARRVAIGEAVDPATRTLEVLFEVTEGAERLKAGMFARVELASGEPERVLAVPEAAVVEAEGRRLVFVHTSAETFEAREVALGHRDGGLIEVTGGLTAGDRVTVTGLGAVRHAPRATASRR